MAILEVARSVDIERDAAVVRRQFGDVAHHAATCVHRGVLFEIISDDEFRCRYRQVSAVGPVKLRQEFELKRTEEGPLVNRIVAGRFQGGAITFEVKPHGEGRSIVDARLTVPVSGGMRILAPILRPQVARQLAAALIEDKLDLEGGTYDPAQQA